MPSNDESDFAKQLSKLIDKHLHLDQLDNTFLAKKMLLSEAQFYRLVKKHFHTSPNALIRQRRLHEARRKLMAYQNLTVREVAYSVGFSHVGYFIRRYQEFFGIRPGERSNAKMY